MSQCKKFAPNIFHKTKCSNCFRQKEEHSAEALECNRASRSIARSGYLFVAPDWDFSVPLNRTKRWQRRWFVLYDDGELNYSVDEHPDTVPQGSVDMSKVLEVTGAEQITGHPHSLALTGPDRVTFVKAASREDARWWAELLAVFPRRHKRNATFPGGRASPSLPQLGRSTSPQPPRLRHLSYIGPTSRSSFTTSQFKIERDVKTKPPIATQVSKKEETPISTWVIESANNWSAETTSLKTDDIVTPDSPPTRDNTKHEDIVCVPINWRRERCKDSPVALSERSQEPSVTLSVETPINLKKGWLWYKEKNTENEWLRRWWVLSGQALTAYIDQDEHSCPEITIGLSTITSLAEIATDTRYGFQINWSGPTYILSAITSSIRSSWLQTLRKATSVLDSPPAPATPRSCLFSSDEEYRTASEGGRRDSEDWGDLPASPSLPRTTVPKVRDRTRLKSRLPRNQSRQSTLDSVSTDELDAYKQLDEVDTKSFTNKSVIDVNGLRDQLSTALNEVQRFETELLRCKKLQSESLVREQQAKEIIEKLERSEKDLGLKLRQNEEKHNRDHETLQDRLRDAEEFVGKTEEKHLRLIQELQSKQKIISSLQEELDCLNVKYTTNQLENDRLYKKIQELECKPHRRKRLDSLTELIDLNADIDWESLNSSELVEQCLDMRSRLETAVVEIKAMKKELRESHIKYDRLELEAVGLRNNLKAVEQQGLAQSGLMADRVQDLTVKLATAEKQTRNLKSKLQDSREKRRSLSLKGRENFSINKEIEDKITELEAKILSLERTRSRRKLRRERSSERASPIDEKSQHRLRRKSLDSATSPEPIKLFMRLNNLEGKITNVTNSSESLNTSSTSYSDMKTDQIGNSNIYTESVILAAIEKLNDCKYAFNLLKTSTNNMNVNELNILENQLSELSCVLNSSIRENEINAIHSSAYSIVRQLENVLKEKLRSLIEKKRTLIKLKELSDEARLEILAEKFAYENVIIDRIQQALSLPIFNNNNCTRLLLKESIETMNLLCNLNEKLCERRSKQIPTFKTSADYLTKILTKRLLLAAHSYKLNKRVKDNLQPILIYLEEEQAKVSALMDTYKLNKLPQLADALALETINTATDSNVRLLSEHVVDEVWTCAREAVNSELMESEISHIMMRTAQLYEQKSSVDQNYFFTFFAYERAMLELWSNSVETQLQLEMDRNIEELTKMFKYSLSKLQRQHWKKRIESHRSIADVKILLAEFADVISHKSLIDARINVLKSECKLVEGEIGESEGDSFSVYLENEKHFNYFEEIGLIQTDQNLEAEFKCMLGQYKVESEDMFTKLDLLEVRKSLQGLSGEILDLVNYCTGKTMEDSVPIINLYDVYNQCEKLKSHLSDIKQNVMHSKIIVRSVGNEEKQPLYLGTEYLNQVENLRAAYRRTLSECENHRQQGDLEQLQVLCEQVLVAMEHWHRKALVELREQHTRELRTLQHDKDQALAEETQATLAALDAMRKAHEAEVQREVAKFKVDFARKQHDELLELTDRLSVKCLEAAALEEQLGSAARQLANAQQHILQLERNPQLSLQN